MNVLEEAEKLLATMTREEKAQLLQWVVRDLGDTFSGIESTQGVCGGDPCIARTRIPVWVLENYRRLGATDADLLRTYPTISAEDLANAWAYVRSHRDEIEQQIRESEDLDFSGLADRIHKAIEAQPDLSNCLIQVYRPQK